MMVHGPITLQTYSLVPKCLGSEVFRTQRAVGWQVSQLTGWLIISTGLTILRTKSGCHVLMVSTRRSSSAT